MRRAVYLDRDGTVIVDRGYLADAGGVELLPRAGEALARLAHDGFLLVLVTNQSGIGRGYFGPDAVDAQHRRLADLLADCAVGFAAAAVCPHAPWEACQCRKPKPGLLLDTAERLDIDLSQSFMVGDKISDTQAGRSAGCTTVLLGNGSPLARPAACDHVAPDIGAAADWILRSAEDQGDDGV